MNYSDLVEFDTELTADVVAWRPEASTMQDSSMHPLACGTYFLNKETKQRQGCLYLLDFDEDQCKLSVTNTLDDTSSGILDLAWLDAERIVKIDSNNRVEFLRYNRGGSETPQLNSLRSVELNNSETSESAIGLTLDHSGHKVLTGDSLGFISLLGIENEMFKPVIRLKAHDYEVWSVHIDRNNENVVYSGADDSSVKMWDMRESQRQENPVASLKWSFFGGGVCSIITPQRFDSNGSSAYLSGFSDNQLLCSSYDEKIYVVDRRNAKRSVAESAKLNGGVWKMKLHPSKDILLCACMHVGVHVVDTAHLKSVLFYDKHGVDTLAYGCDWCPRRSHSGSDLIASCSFYNHNLRVWQMK